MGPLNGNQTTHVYGLAWQDIVGSLHDDYSVLVQSTAHRHCREYNNCRQSPRADETGTVTTAANTITAGPFPSTQETVTTAGIVVMHDRQPVAVASESVSFSLHYFVGLAFSGILLIVF